MYSLNYKVTTSACDSEGRLKLYSALQMMQDCSECKTVFHGTKYGSAVGDPTG